MKAYFALTLPVIYESPGAPLHVVLTVLLIVLSCWNLYYLVGCLLPWQQKVNLVNPILLLKVEVTYFTLFTYH